MVELGLNLVEKGRSRQVLRQFHLQELHRWGYKPGIMFYFEAKLDGKELSTVEFGTRDGMTMTHLLTDYVQAFMQESELEKARGIAPPSPNNDSETPKVANKTAPHTPLSPPVLTKSNSLPPPPPPPRPASTSIQKQSVASIPSSSTQLSTPTLQKNKQLSKSSSLGPQYTAKHHQCAVKIQSLFRGFSLRNEWIKEDAAILIQAIYRGYAERCRVALMLEELFHSGQLELLDD